MHYVYSTAASNTTCSLVRALLLLALALSQFLLQCNCVQLTPRPPQTAAVTAKHSPGCAISTPTLLRQMGDCSDPIPESQFSYNVQSAWYPAASTDSLQNTVFTYADNGNPTGSFELSHSLRPSDSLLILLAGKDETRHCVPTCQRLVLCNLSVDWPSGQRLRLNLNLKVKHSYAMHIVKLTNSSVMCDNSHSQLRFFYTNPKTSANPQIQLAVKRCEKWAATAAASLTCHADIYLRAHGTDRAWHFVRVQGKGNSFVDFSNLSAHSQNGWVKRQVPELRISNEFLVVRFFSSAKKPVFILFNFYTMLQSGGSFRDQLDQLGQTASPCPSAQLPPPLLGGRPAWTKTSPAHVGLFLGFSLAAVTTMAAATLVWSCFRRRPDRHILLVLPEAATAAAAHLRRCTAVATFRRELLATDAVKRGSLSVREVAGLRRLTPALARDSRLIIFLSDDPAFSCFSLDGLSGEVSLALKTVITEKSRTRGLFVTSGPPPPVASDWALLATQQLGENVRFDHELMALGRMERV